MKLKYVFLWIIGLFCLNTILCDDQEWVPSYLANAADGLPATDADWEVYCRYVVQNEEDETSDPKWHSFVEDSMYETTVKRCFPEEAVMLNTMAAEESILITNPFDSTSNFTSTMMQHHDEDLIILQQQMKEMQERYDALVAYVSNACPNEKLKTLLD